MRTVPRWQEEGKRWVTKAGGSGTVMTVWEVISLLRRAGEPWGRDEEGQKAEAVCLRLGCGTGI